MQPVRFSVSHVNRSPRKSYLFWYYYENPCTVLRSIFHECPVHPWKPKGMWFSCQTHMSPSWTASSGRTTKVGEVSKLDLKCLSGKYLWYTRLGRKGWGMTGSDKWCCKAKLIPSSEKMTLIPFLYHHRWHTWISEDDYKLNDKIPENVPPSDNCP